MNSAQSALFSPPSLSPPQGMLNHWDHVDEAQLCFYTLVDLLYKPERKCFLGESRSGVLLYVILNPGKYYKFCD